MTNKPVLDTIDYGENENKFDYQEPLIQKINYIKSNTGLIAISVKTGHGKTRVQLRYALDSLAMGKNVVIYIIEWDATIQQFYKELTMVVPKCDVYQNGYTIKYTHKTTNKSLSIVKLLHEHKKIRKLFKKYEHYDIHVFDEAHTLMSYLGVRHFASRYSWTDKRIKGYFDQLQYHNGVTPLMDLFMKSKVVLFSATLDADIVQELSVYAGLIPINIICCKPHERVIEDIDIQYRSFEISAVSTTADIANEKYLEQDPNDRMIIFLATVGHVKTLETLLLEKGVSREDIYTSTKDEDFNKNDFKRINLFCDKGTTGVDDPHINLVIIGRDMSDVNTNRGKEYKCIFSYRQEQMMGRIRKKGDVVVVSKKNVRIDSYKTNVLQRIDHTINEFKFTYERMFQLLPWRFKDNDISNIRTTREKMQHLHLPALLNTLIRDKVYEVKICKSAFLKIQQSNDYKYLVENCFSEDNLETYSKIYNRVCENMLEAYINTFPELSHSMDLLPDIDIEELDNGEPECERAQRNPCDHSISTHTKPTRTIPNTRPTCTIKNTLTDNSHAPSKGYRTFEEGAGGFTTEDVKDFISCLEEDYGDDLSGSGSRHPFPSGKRIMKERERDVCSDIVKEQLDIRSGKVCELCKTEVGIQHKSRIYEGKTGGRYSIDNVIRLCPTCHSVFDFNETEDKLRICFDVDVDKNCIQFYATDNEEGRKHEGMARDWNKNISKVITQSPGILDNFLKRKQCDKERYHKNVQ